MGYLEQGPQSSQIFSAALPLLELPLLGGTVHCSVVRLLWWGKGVGERCAVPAGNEAGSGIGPVLWA